MLPNGQAPNSNLAARIQAGLAVRAERVQAADREWDEAEKPAKITGQQLKVLGAEPQPVGQLHNTTSGVNPVAARQLPGRTVGDWVPRVREMPKPKLRTESITVYVLFAVKTERSWDCYVRSSKGRTQSVGSIPNRKGIDVDIWYFNTVYQGAATVSTSDEGMALSLAGDFDDITTLVNTMAFVPSLNPVYPKAGPFAVTAPWDYWPNISIRESMAASDPGRVFGITSGGLLPVNRVSNPPFVYAPTPDTSLTNQTRTDPFWAGLQAVSQPILPRAGGGSYDGTFTMDGDILGFLSVSGKRVFVHAATNFYFLYNDNGTASTYIFQENPDEFDPLIGGGVRTFHRTAVPYALQLVGNNFQSLIQTNPSDWRRNIATWLTPETPADPCAAIYQDESRVNLSLNPATVYECSNVDPIVGDASTTVFVLKRQKTNFETCALVDVQGIQVPLQQINPDDYGALESEIKILSIVAERA